MSYCYDIDEKYNEEPSMALPPSYDDSTSVSLAPPSFELTVEREQLALERLQLEEDRARLIEATKELARLRADLEERERLLTLRLPPMPADVPAYNLSKVPEFWEYLRSAIHRYRRYNDDNYELDPYKKGILSWFPTIPKYVCTYMMFVLYHSTNSPFIVYGWVFVVTSKQVYRISFDWPNLNMAWWNDPKLEYVFDHPLLEHQASMMIAYSSTPYVRIPGHHCGGGNPKDPLKQMEQQFWALVHTIPGRKP